MVALFKKPNLPREELRAAVSPLIFAVYLCLTQAVIMFGVALVFSNSMTASNWTHDRLNFLISYMPLLWRYQSAYHDLGRDSEFPAVFSTFVSEMILQLLFLSLIAWRLRQNIDIRSNSNRFKSFSLWGLLFFSQFANLELILGPFGLVKNIVLFDTFQRQFMYCILIPASNFVLFLAIFATFGTSVSKIAEVPPKSPLSP